MKIKAWVRPLKPDKYGPRWQYLFSAPGAWVWGAAYSREDALKRIGNAAWEAGYVTGWEIEDKPPLGKWAG